MSSNNGCLIAERKLSINYFRIKISRTHWQSLQYLLRSRSDIEILSKDLGIHVKRARIRLAQLEQLGFVILVDGKYVLTPLGMVVALMQVFNYHYAVNDKANEKFVRYTQTYKERYPIVKLFYALACINRIDLIKHLKHELTCAIKAHRYGLVKLKVYDWIEEVLCLFNVKYERNEIDNALDILGSSILKESANIRYNSENCNNYELGRIERDN